MFLVGTASVVLLLIALFSKYNQDIDRAKILEALALAFGIAGAMSELGKPTESET